MTTARMVIPLAFGFFAGSALLLSELRWFRRGTLTERLVPYAAVPSTGRRTRLLSAASFHDVIAPFSRAVGERVARLFGVSEELAVRLRRIHSPLDVTTFRIRQIAWAATAFTGATIGALAFDLSPALAMLAILGAPVLAFLVVEQQVAAASSAWQRRLFLELPVIAEQLGMLVSAGWSTNAALDRIASRGTGNCAADLRRVRNRNEQGLSERDALIEWGDLAKVDGLDRLISVLAMTREAADVGRLVSDEAHAIRRDAQRELIESIERRNQQVWIPVTVAALVPGVLLMGVPFVDALTLFSTS